jgi:hypothetical protein
MSKISKTAAASIKGAQMPAKVDPFDTNEKKIKELRNQRRDKLAVGRFDFIDALIEEYDAVVKQSKTDIFVMGEISACRDEIAKELEAARKINQALLGMNEKLNGQLNQAILQRDEARAQADSLALEIVTAKALTADLSALDTMTSEGGHEPAQET